MTRSNAIQAVRRLSCQILAMAIVLSTLSLAKANEEIYSRLLRSTTWIVSPTGDSGTGVLIDEQRRLIVSNQHVVGDNPKVMVFFPIEQQGQFVGDADYYTRHAEEHGIVGRVIRADIQRDLAIIQLEHLPSDRRAVPLGSPARPGQPVHSIGNPSASDSLWIYTAGHVRANYYKRFQVGNMRRMQVVETQSPINPGDSGGPIVNDRGELVGVSQSYITDGRLVSIGVDITEISWLLGNLSTEDVAATPQDESRRPVTSSPSAPSVSTVAAIQKSTVQLDGDRSQVVMVDRDAAEHLGNRTTRVWTLATTIEGDIPSDLALHLLEQNGRTKMGGWVIEKQEGQTFVMFVCHLPANCGDPELQAAIDYTGKIAATLN